MAEPEAFLRRWSRLKQTERTKKAAPQPMPAEPPPAVVAELDDPLKDLPPLESLTKESDFAPFMRPGVPEGLRNAALRKLWASDPVYANLDGLLEYGEDFGEPFRIAGVVATVYRVLEGMPSDDEAETADEERSRLEEGAAELPAPVEREQDEG